MTKLLYDRTLAMKNILLQPTCNMCKHQFEWGVNIFSEGGVYDADLIGICETCLSKIMEKEEPESDDD